MAADPTPFFTDFKGRWYRKIRGDGKGAINQVLSGIAAIGGYLKFERAVSL